MAVTILQVPGVTVRGFRSRADRPNTFCVGIGGVAICSDRFSRQRLYAYRVKPLSST
jgi:hypothetical protein